MHSSDLITFLEENVGCLENLNITCKCRTTKFKINFHFHQGKKFLLPPLRKCDLNKKCLIIDLDETLVHSSFQVF